MSGAGPSAGGGPDGDRVDRDLLADYLGGALAGTPEQQRVADLVATDPAWRAAAAELSGALAAVGTDLARLPAPSMPADVAERLEEALRRPVAAGHAEPARPGGGRPEPDPPGPPRPVGPPSRRPRQRVGGRPPASQRPPGGRPDSGRRARPRRRPARWASGVAAAAALVAAVAVGVDHLGWPGGADNARQEDALSADGAPDHGASGGSALPDLVASGTDYRRSSLPATPPSAPPPAPAVDGAPELQPRTTGSDSNERDGVAAVDPALRAIWTDPGPCLAEIERLFAPHPVTVEVVDFAAFEGESGLIAWVATGGGGRQVVVAGPACGRPGYGADLRHRTPVE